MDYCRYGVKPQNNQSIFFFALEWHLLCPNNIKRILFFKKRFIGKNDAIKDWFFPPEIWKHRRRIKSFKTTLYWLNHIYLNKKLELQHLSSFERKKCISVKYIDNRSDSNIGFTHELMNSLCTAAFSSIISSKRKFYNALF